MKKHQAISRELRAEIAAGAYSGGKKLPSESQLVARFGASRPTVIRALNDLQQEGLIERRAGSGTFLRNQPAVPPTRVLGLLVPGRGGTEVLDVICGELGSFARLAGYGLLWGRSTHPLQDRTLDAQLAEEACHQFIARQVSGVLFAPFERYDKSDTVNLRLLDMLRQAGIPVVLLDRDVAGFPLRSEFDLVSIDNVQAGFLMAEHLIRLGCKQLRFLLEPGSAPTLDARLAGVREALLKNGISPPVNLRSEGSPEDGKFIKRLLGSKVEAVICGNDFTAARLLKTLTGLGVRVPHDLRISGFDDVRYATLVAVSLTTIRQPYRELAQVAFHTLEERIREPTLPVRTILLKPSLVVRDSCGVYQPLGRGR
jgi:DNA-binding LacI/PurR family transcriptional regulator